MIAIGSMRTIVSLSALALACGGANGGGDEASSAATSAGSSGDGATSAVDSTSTSSATDGASTSGGSSSDTDRPIFDVGTENDVGSRPGPIIPETCEQAAATPTTVGCRFYGVDLDQNGPLENDQYAIAVSNVQPAVDANVIVEEKIGGVWQMVAQLAVPPLDLHPFPLPNKNQQSSGVLVGGTYRVSSDVPIIAYQFNPLVMGSYSSDASMLYPVTSWDSINHVLHWGGGYGHGYITIAAAFDGTMVEVTPTVTTQAGTGVPAGTPGMPIAIALDEGDIAEVMVVDDAAQLTGTRVISDAAHPVAVFSGHECAWIPHMISACDHIEEQLSGVRLWGHQFVAARVPVRETGGTPESSLWQIYASEDDTEVTITAHAEVTGVPATPTTLDAGEQLEFYASGTFANPGDFVVEADKPIAVANYMTGEANLLTSTLGDPAMVQLSPIEQFLPRYVVLVPSEWTYDMFVVTRAVGSAVLIDGVAIDDAEFVAVGPAYEVARVPAIDGVHMLESAAGFSVVVVGYDDADSYAYLGGSSTGVINPNPEG